ncbi:MAG: NADH-quinone oxidoreductase subunit NuoN [Thermodesulfovibrionales bacterium]
MAAADLALLLPFIVPGAAGVVLLVAIAFRRSHGLAFALSAAGMALSAMALVAVADRLPARVAGLLVLDGYSVLYMGMVYVTALLVAVLSYGHLERRGVIREEYYLLMVLAALGSAVVVSSGHFASFFVGLEVLSVSLYALIAYERTRDTAVEAGLKYLVLAGASSAFVLLGMALVYFDLGTMGFAGMASAVSSRGQAGALSLAGAALITVGVGFKLGAAPFHMWTPDVYQGAPAPVSGFLATVSKGSVLALLLRQFADYGLEGEPRLFVIFSAAAVASMFAGNLLALFQDNIKRVLAYSSIAHVGYMLAALVTSGPVRVTAVTYYLAAYFVTTIGAFGAVTAASGPDREADRVEDYRGMAWRRPWLAAVFMAMLLSLAGIPATAGFIGKFYVVAAGVSSSLWWLVAAVVVNSAIGVYYYLRVATVMFAREEGAAAGGKCTPSSGLVLALMAAALLVLGLWPGPAIGVIEAVASGLR